MSDVQQTIYFDPEDAIANVERPEKAVQLTIKFTRKCYCFNCYNYVMIDGNDFEISTCPLCRESSTLYPRRGTNCPELRGSGAILEL